MYEYIYICIYICICIYMNTWPSSASLPPPAPPSRRVPLDFPPLLQLTQVPILLETFHSRLLSQRAAFLEGCATSRKDCGLASKGNALCFYTHSPLSLPFLLSACLLFSDCTTESNTARCHAIQTDMCTHATVSTVKRLELTQSVLKFV